MTDNIQEGAAPPDRHQRQACWDARDAYFGCLDSLKVDVPGQEGRACLQPRQAFEKDCVKSWVDYFTKRRVMQARQRMMEEQAAKSPGTPAAPLKKPNVPSTAASATPPAAQPAPPPPATDDKLV